MTVKLSAALPKEADSNGMDKLNSQLIAHPDRRHLVVMVVDTDRINQKHDGRGGLRAEPTAGILFIEPITDPEDVEQIVDIMGRVRAERVDDATLDFDFGVGDDRFAKAAFDLRTASGVYVGNDTDEDAS
ncbi:hypothetical protein [Microbacterium esteraromaticum]|uniref:hypothetical protein n=1 Tax=Microbacterium esteraromaticum TaxID=57043 RepID=UPI0019D3920F|nr:hypothetical protein [Microbacterium esteraromaticum]MBN7792398.1 hypothetical protein [Microbacterium esteraromaticum]